MEISFISAFFVGLFSTVHCLGMCGGIIGALTFSLPEHIRSNRWRLIPYVSAYNIGRITSYSLAGALAGGVILIGRDGCYRDIAGMHGTYRKVEETIPAIELTGRYLAELHLERCLWYLDRPVSNSGRLKALLEEFAEKENWTWEVELVYSPDGMLVRAEEAAATSDSEILNRCQTWFNLAREVINQHVPEAWLIDLGK